MSTDEYTVSQDPFAEKHYLKKFKKKYKSRWDVVWTAVILQIKRYEENNVSSVFTTIADAGAVRMCKMEFRIAGKGPSRKSSGNRIIVVFHREKRTARILLVYHKQDLVGSGSETDKWKRLISDHFPGYQGLLK